MSWMIAYGKMKESGAFRNLCRAKRLIPSDYNDVAKNIDDYKNHPVWGEIIEESQMFVGVIDSVSPHPCANLLLSNPISEEIGTVKVGDLQVALIDSNYSDKYKYLKNDYLTVTVWKIIAEVYESIGQPIDDVRTLIAKTKDDDKVWKLYKDGIVATLNQAGTQSGKPQIMQYKPNNIRELSGWVAAIRPAFASLKHYFLNRKEFSYGIPQFDKILESSDNFVLYQENIMATLTYVGFSEDSTYGLLKAISKKKEGIIEPIHDQFIDGFIEKTGSKEDALEVWKIIENATSYGFNSSHSYAVALDSLYGAYLKANYPLEYYTAVLNIYNGSKEKQGEIIRELDHFNIKIKPIEFGKSQSLYKENKKDRSIYKGIESIAHLNQKVATQLFELSKTKNYELFTDVLIDIQEKTSTNSRQLKILIQLDYFKIFGDKNILLKIFEFFDGFYKKTLVPATKEKRLPWLKEVERMIYCLPYEKETIEEQVEFERDMLGYPMTTFPEINENLYYVLDIDKKYTPKILLYRLSDGEESLFKMKKGKFYVRKNADSLYNDASSIYQGDVIRLTDTSEQFGNKKNADGEWVKTENIETFIEGFKIVRKSKERKLAELVE